MRLTYANAEAKKARRPLGHSEDLSVLGHTLRNGWQALITSGQAKPKA